MTNLMLGPGTGTGRANLSLLCSKASGTAATAALPRHLKITAHLPVFDQRVVFSREMTAQQRLLQDVACPRPPPTPRGTHRFVIFMD